MGFNNSGLRWGEGGGGHTQKPPLIEMEAVESGRQDVQAVFFGLFVGEFGHLRQVHLQQSEEGAIATLRPLRSFPIHQRCIGFMAPSLGPSHYLPDGTCQAKWHV